MSYLSFVHGQCFFAVPVGQVQYIVAENQIKQTKIASNREKNQQVFQFENEICHVIDMDNIAQTQSEFGQSKDLSSLLAQREQDHVDWLNALEESLSKDIPFSKATDPNQCEFGKWYKDFKTNDEYLNQILARFDEPHRLIHSLAHELLAMKEQGQRKEALAMLATHRSTTLMKLKKIFADAQAVVVNLIRPTVIILRTQKQHLIALKVDKIGQVLDVNQKIFNKLKRRRWISPTTQQG